MPIVQHSDRVVQLICPIPFFEGTVNVYLLLGDPLTLIDAPTNLPDSIAGFEANLQELGLATTDIRRVLCTHAHTDHMGMARYIQDRSGCEFWVHEDEADGCARYPKPFQERHAYSQRQLYEWGIPEEPLRAMIGRRWDPGTIAEPVRVTHTVVDGDEISCDGFTLQVIHVPGHSMGHVVFYAPESAIMFSGDHVLPDIVPFADIMYLEPEGPRRFSGLNHFLHAQKRLRRMHISRIYPAHGPVIEQPWQAIENIQLFHEKRMKQVERALRRGADSVYSIAERVYKELGDRNLRHRLMLVMGCLDVLEERGRVASDRSGPVWRFRPIPKAAHGA